MKFNSRLSGAVTFILLSLIYIFLANARSQLDDSDIFRVVEQFEFSEMTAYTWREPLYWLVGKWLTGIFVNPWVGIVLIDLTCFYLLALRSKGIKHSPVYAFFIIISPFSILGFANIHRQLVGFFVWFCIVQRSTLKFQGRDLLTYILPALIHNSLLFFSVIHFFCRLQKIKHQIFFLMLMLPAVILMLNLTLVSEDLFREGTETNTSIFAYLMWTLVISTAAYDFFKRDVFLLKFYSLAILFSVLMFELSGASSGSRMFLMVNMYLAMEIYLNKDQLFQDVKLKIFLIYVLILLPTLVHPFTTQILLTPFKI